MTLKEFYEIAINNKLKMSDFYKLLVIESIKEEKVDALVETLKPLKKVIDGLIAEDLIYLQKGLIRLKRVNYNRSRYSKMLKDNLEVSIPFSEISKQFFQEWRGKFGITKGRKYSLLDKSRAQKELLEFINEHKDIPIDIILQANKEFLENLEIESNGYYKYAPKCSTFIKGNEKNEYLIEYCYNIIERGKAQVKIRNLGSDAYSGFGEEI